MSQLYCEHNRRGLLMYSLYGRFRVYTCVLDKRYHKDWMAGWNEPCVAACTQYHRRPDGERTISFPYKRIPFGEIPMDKEALRQEQEEKQEMREKAKELKEEALILIKKADELEKEAKG